ncbi:MAG TPA: hypothetical protein VK920_10810 [Solirubrobacterales bacterium]|nr:hypothetical protein [Solirubrobacterales bacterium]
MARVLYVHSRKNTFTDIDRTALAERFEIEDYFQPSAGSPRRARAQAAPGRRPCSAGSRHGDGICHEVELVLSG